MAHIDEHTLELYVLEAEEVAVRRRQIGSHLRACAPCSALAAEIRGFYDLTELLYNGGPAESRPAAWAPSRSEDSTEQDLFDRAVAWERKQHRRLSLRAVTARRKTGSSSHPPP